MRTFRVIVGGNEYEVAIEEITEKTGSAAPARKPEPAQQATKSTPQPAARAAAPAAAQPAASAPAGDGAIIAPMPGTIIDVKVSLGNAVKRGDTLMIMEAMKMENEIKAPCDGVVSTIEVAKGAAVNAGMVLMVLT